jgi:hypothetical protein
MLDLAKDYWHAADEIVPLPPAETGNFQQIDQK